MWYSWKGLLSKKSGRLTVLNEVRSYDHLDFASGQLKQLWQQLAGPSCRFVSVRRKAEYSTPRSMAWRMVLKGSAHGVESAVQRDWSGVAVFHQFAACARSARLPGLRRRT